MARKALVVFFSLVSISLFGKDIPKPNDGQCYFVTDYANVLSDEQENKLCAKLQAYTDSTSNEFVVVMDNSLDGEDVYTYSQTLAETWGIGKDDTDNGLLIYVAVKDRKMHIQVGRGLEHRITDAYSGRVVDYILTPNFRNVGYYEGVDKAVDQLILFAAGEYKGGAKPDNGFPTWMLIVLIIIIIIIFSSFGSNNGRTYRNRTGGWIMGPGAGGYIGGGGGGFTGGGGGFGGFGGGSFGGGGAGGSW